MVEVRLVCPRKRCNRARMREGVLPQCPDCRGVWIPESALHERIAQRQQKPPQLAWRREARAVLACLVCQAPMETLCLFDIPVDRCRGHGLWLDGGELEGVLDHCTRARRSNESHTLDVAGDVAIGVAEVGIEGAIVAADVALDAATIVGYAVSNTASGNGPDIPLTPGTPSASDIDVPVPTAALGVGAMAPPDASPLVEAADVGGGVAEGAADVAGAAADGAGGALEAVGDAIGTVASGSVTVVTTIVEGLLDGLGSILDL